MPFQIIRNDITKVSATTPAFAQDMKRLSVRRAVAEDLNRIMYIYSSAQEFMIASGNPTQWGHFYPDEDLIREDIEKMLDSKVNLQLWVKVNEDWINNDKYLKKFKNNE